MSLLTNGTLEAAQVLITSHSSWIEKKAQEIEQESDAGELIEMIVELRNWIHSEGIEIVDLTAFLEHCRSTLSNQGFFLNDEVFDALKREIRASQRGNGIDLVKHHKKKKHKEVRINSKTAVGFLKFVAGGLLCIVPFPPVQGVGIGLAVLGVSEMADGAREQADDRQADKRFEANRRIESSLSGGP